jgi:hypothetical protein
VSVVPSADERSAVTDQLPLRRRIRAQGLILCCYLAGAVAVTWHLWADPAGRMQVGDLQDVNLFAWFMYYSATAISHGHLPALITKALDWPRGVNMMWNTAYLLPGILLTPVTLLAGAQVSLTVVLTLSIAGSAASLMWVLRRWGASLAAAALGGAVYGFSPALLNSGTGHYQLVLAVLPPLIIDRALRIVTGRGRPVREGVWLGLLTAAQLFIGEEMLVYTAAAGLLLIAVAALGHPRSVPARIRDGALGLATGAAVTLVICGYPLWVQFRGPLREHSTLYSLWSGNLAYFVDPSGSLLFHSRSSAAVVASYPLGLPEELSYLGWPLIIVLIVAAACFWRDARVRAAAVACAVLELCNLGSGTLTIRGFRLSGSFLPFHWLQALPTMPQVLPDRFCILAAGAAGAVLAFSLDRARAAVPRTWRWQAVPAAIAAAAVLPLIPLPYQTVPVPPVPAGWQASFARLRLPPNAPVLIVPVTIIGHTDVMRWEADTGEPGTMVGGYFQAPSSTGQAVFSLGSMQPAANFLNKLWAGKGRDRSGTRAMVRAALAYWRPDAIIAITGMGSPLERFLAAVAGRPAFRAGQVVAWRR